MSTGLLTVVDDYIAATIRQANAWVDDEGFVVAHVQGYPGVRAHGDDVRTCRIALAQEIEQWVRTWLHQGYVLPIVDDIDLNAADAAVLAKYHPYPKDHDPMLDIVLSDKEFLAQLSAA